MATTTEVQTLKAVLDDANPQLVASALQKIKLGTVLDVQTQTVSQSAADTITLESANPLAILNVSVTAAAANRSGVYVEHDTATAPYADNGVGTFTIDAGRTTLTFAGSSDITAATIRYIPNVAEALSNTFANAG